MRPFTPAQLDAAQGVLLFVILVGWIGLGAIVLAFLLVCWRALN